MNYYNEDQILLAAEFAGIDHETANKLISYLHKAVIYEAESKLQQMHDVTNICNTCEYEDVCLKDGMCFKIKNI